MHLAGCKTLASSNFASQPIKSSSTASNHLRRLGMGLSRPPECRFFASTSRLVDAAAAVAFALHYRSPSRHRDVTAPLIARAAPRRRRSQPPARLRLFGLGWAAQQFSARARTAGTRAQRRRRPTAAWPLPRATRRPTRAARATRAPQTPSRRRPAMRRGNYLLMPLEGKLCLPSHSTVYARLRYYS